MVKGGSRVSSEGTKDDGAKTKNIAGQNVMGALDTLAERIAAVEEGAAYKIKFAASCGGYDCNQKGSVCLPGRPGAGNDTWVCNGNTWERKTTYGT
jgi:hypothetical protein